MPSLRIPARLLRALILRGTVLWFLAQLMGNAIMAAARTSNGEATATMVPLWALVMLPGLLLVVLWRRKELALLHNLGVTTRSAVIVACLPALVLEAGLLMFVQ